MTLKDWIEQNRITEVECIIPDLAGAARGKIIPASKFVGSSALPTASSLAKFRVIRSSRFTSRSMKPNSIIS
jgi:glutamine synthetase